jgi:flagellum-specific peptidoglycan hydrolase FlgJ
MNKIFLFILILILFSSWKTNTKKVNQSETTLQYIERFKKVAIAEHKRFCIPASITLAQGILESASGQSMLVKKTNNHFGIKCFGGCNNKNSYMMADDDPTDRFIKYKSAWYSFRHHSRFLEDNKRYERCFECGDDYKCWARQLKRCGYATSKTYTKKLIKIIETYQLYKYDK